eukprot:489920-Lingulodinium_polyedra.AAC.1
MARPESSPLASVSGQARQRRVRRRGCGPWRRGPTAWPPQRASCGTWTPTVQPGKKQEPAAGKRP